MRDSLRGKRVTVMGLGGYGGGAGVARYLAGAGAIVTVTDAQPAEKLQTGLAALAGLPIRFVLGGHDEADFTPAGADLVIRNPGVRRTAPLLALARKHGVPIEMEMSLFLRACPAPIIGVTGTKGKTTTATLCAAMLREWRTDTVLAGNMGISALAALPSITPATPVVLELSSWQLEALAEHGLSPHIAVITNIAEDHLNTYDSFDHYADTKRAITAAQTGENWLVLNRDDPETWRAAAMTRARVVPFGLSDPGSDGAWWNGSAIVWRLDGEEWTMPRPVNPALVGDHQLRNLLAALAAARVRGATRTAIHRGIRDFTGVPDRMEPVATVNGVRFVNDTTATAPVAAAAALRAFAANPVHLIAGGASKELSPEPLAAAAAETGARVYLLDGSATPALAAALRAAGVEPAGHYSALIAAIDAARANARAGDVILLSPGSASFGMFRNEFDRGEQFRAYVRALGQETAS